MDPQEIEDTYPQLAVSGPYYLEEAQLEFAS
jgi:hypothetical protein